MAEAPVAEGGVIEHVNRLHVGLQPGTDVRAIRAGDIETAMSQLATVMNKPVYIGDPETALVYHLGREAFNNIYSHEVHALNRLTEEVGESDGDGPTPVMIGYKVRSGNPASGRETAVVLVDPAQPLFRSAVEHKRGLKQEGFADQVAVTQRDLVLLGRATTISADFQWRLRGDREKPSIPWNARTESHPEGLLLSRFSLFNGRNGSTPLERDPRSAVRDPDHLYNSPHFTVGWAAVAKVLGRRVNDVSENNIFDDRGQGQHRLDYVIQLRGFLERSGMLEGLTQHNSALSSIFTSAVKFEEALSAVAPPAQEW